MQQIINKYLTPYSGKVKQFYNLIDRDKKNISVFGLQFGEKTILSAPFKRAIFVCNDYLSANKMYDQLKDLRKNVVFMPAKDEVLVYHKKQSGDNHFKRLDAMFDWHNNDDVMLVTTADALIQLYPKKNDFIDCAIKFSVNQDYSLEDIATNLVNAGYKRVEQVESPGSFSLRGDILDIRSSFSDYGVRLEFFGDCLESIKYFDVSEQVTTNSTQEYLIKPMSDIFYDSSQVENLLNFIKKDIVKSKSSDFIDSVLSEIILSLNANEKNMALNFIMPYLEHCNFNEFFNPDYIFFEDAKRVYDNVIVKKTEHDNRYKTHLSKGDVLKKSNEQMYEPQEIFDELDCRKIAFHNLLSQNRIFNPQAILEFESVEIPDYSRNVQDLCDDVNMWLERSYNVVIFAGNEKIKENLVQLFAERKVGQLSTTKGTLNIHDSKLEKGAIFHEQKLVILGSYNVTKKAVKKIIKRSKKDVFTQANVGDYVVHNVHGIGFCEAIQRLELNGAERDYVVIRYKNDDKLYVPVENMDSLSRYVTTQENPQLSKIGGADFAKVKEKVKASVKAMAIDLLALYAHRSNQQGYIYPQEDSLLDEFSQEFGFDETEDQLTAISDCINDLKQGKIMDRLLCGDVGYGKTEVALRAAFKVIIEGHQVAFISPTTILAKQHFNTVKKRMESFGVNIASLTRFDSAKEIEKTLKGLQRGEIDIVCGTHRVFSKDIKFNKLGLLILDEEQRFGVADKEKIKDIKKDVNVLTLSATPIPRTLHMSMTGIRDISVLDTPPSMRIPIQTYVSEFSDSLIIDSVTRELNRGGQVFIIYNRVQTIERFASKISALLPDASISVGHGQMGEGQLEKVIQNFISGGSDILIATTIIENGIDMPNANTLIVIDADNFGLSQLYQLRGRVGRSDRLAYAYFTFDSQRILTETAEKRLSAITEYTDFGSGFKIAMRDLQIRGAGNILGREQHGHIEKVGYDMYCKLLNNAVKELGDGTMSDDDSREVKVHTDYNAFIPDKYILDAEWRIRIYSRISNIQNNKDRLKLASEIKDIYGDLPSSLENLMLISMVKNLASKIKAKSVYLLRDKCVIEFEKTQDIGAKVVSLAGSKLNPLTASIDFKKDKVGLINFLIKNNKK